MLICNVPAIFLLWVLLLRSAFANVPGPVAPVTCTCDMPLGGTVGANRYTCSNGIVGVCARNEQCWPTDSFGFAERGTDASCRESVVTCTCVLPRAGTVGFNRIQCSDGSTRSCFDNEECFRSEERAVDNVRDLCRAPRVRQRCQNGDIRLEDYPEGRIDIYQDGQWYPLCPAGFTDNNHGANTVCHKLGFENGQLVPDSTGTTNAFLIDAFEVGACQPGQSLNTCGGAQDFSPQCRVGQTGGTSVTCFNPQGIHSQAAECDDSDSDEFLRSVDVIIGPSLEPTKTVEVSEIASGCFNQNYQHLPLGFGGHGRTVETDARACQARCRGTRECAYFSYFDDGSCHLHDSSATTRLQDGVVTGPERCAPLYCPPLVNRDVWLGDESVLDAFDVTVDGNEVTTRRVDTVGGWGLDLRIRCTTSKHPLTLDKSQYYVGEPIKITWQYDSTRMGADRILIYPVSSTNSWRLSLTSSLWIFACGSQECDPDSLTCPPGERCLKAYEFGPGGFEQSGAEEWPLSAGEYVAVLLPNNRQEIQSLSVEFEVTERFQPSSRVVFPTGPSVTATERLPRCQQASTCCEDSGYLRIDNEIDCEHYCRRSYDNFSDTSTFSETAQTQPGCYVLVNGDVVNGETTCHWNDGSRHNANSFSTVTTALCYTPATLERLGVGIPTGQVAPAGRLSCGSFQACVSYFDDIEGTRVEDLLNAPTFPDGSDEVGSLGRLELPRNRRENYGAMVEAWFRPRQTGSYRFIVESDDSSRVFLHTTPFTVPATDSLMVQVADQSCCSKTEHSISVNLVAGRSYFVRGYMKEGFRGDYFTIGVRAPDGAEIFPLRVNDLGYSGAVTVAVGPSGESNTKTVPVQRGLTCPRTVNIDNRLLDGSVNDLVDTTDTWDITNSGNSLTVRNSNGRGWFVNLKFDCFLVPEHKTVAGPAAGVLHCGSFRGCVDFYDNIGQGQNVEDLFNAPKFPDNPDKTKQLTALNEPVNRANNYGARVTAWFKPRQTGIFTFIIDSDDGSRVYLSTTANVVPRTDGEMLMVADQSCCGRREHAVPVNLVAGMSYFLRAYLKDALGNDRLLIGVRNPDGTETFPLQAKDLGFAGALGCGGTTACVTYYDNIAGNSVNDLFQSPNFPESADSRNDLSELSIGQHGFNYGAVVEAWFRPLETTSYRFTVNNDDDVQVFLMTTPGVVPQSNQEMQLVVQHGCCGRHDGTTRLDLTKGHSYLLRAFFKQALGGDFLQIGAVTEAGNEIWPITSTHLGFIPSEGAEEVGFVDVWVGRGQLNSVTVAADCFDEGYQRFPYDIIGEGRTTENNAQECQARCDGVLDCAYFTFFDDGSCHLASAQAARIPQSDSVSGPPNCPTTGLRCPAVVNSTNWATPTPSQDNTAVTSPRFEVSTRAGVITVTREDVNTGWDFDLVLRCEPQPRAHREASCIKNGSTERDCCGLLGEISCSAGYQLAQPLRLDVCDRVACGSRCDSSPAVRAYRCVPIPEEKGWQHPLQENMSCGVNRRYQGRIGLEECQRRCELDPLCYSIFGALDYGDRTCWTCDAYLPRRARDLSADFSHSNPTAPVHYRAWELRRESRWSYTPLINQDQCPRGFEALTRRECELLGRSIISTELTRGIVDDDTAPGGCSITNSALTAFEAMPRWSTRAPGDVTVRGSGRRLVCKQVIEDDGLVTYNYTHFRSPIVNGGLLGSVFNGRPCVDGNTATFCRSEPATDAFLEFDLDHPLVVLRVWVANRGGSSLSDLGRFNVMLFDGHAWQYCARRFHYSTEQQWSEVNCAGPIEATAVRIQLADRTEPVSLSIADVRLQGISIADATITTPHYREHERSQTCNVNAILQDLSCTVGASDNKCIDEGKQACNAWGIRCWGFAITEQSVSSVVAIQLYDRRAPQPQTCDGTLGLRVHRQWTTFQKEETRLLDHLVIDRQCYRYTARTDAFELKRCPLGQRDFAQATVDQLRQVLPCINAVGDERRRCVEELQFRRRMGEERYRIYDAQKAQTRRCLVLNGNAQRQSQRRLEEKSFEELAKAALLKRLAGKESRRRLTAVGSQCRQRAQVNNDRACSNLKDAATLSVELYQDQVAIAERNVEQMRAELGATISNGALGLFSDIASIGLDVASGNVLGAVSGGIGLIGNTVQLGFDIDTAEQEIEFAKEEVEFTRREADIAALRDLSDSVQTCDQASTDDLGCELEELGDSINRRFFQVVEASSRNHIEVMASLARQNAIIARTTLTLESILEGARRARSLAESNQAIFLNFEEALEDIERARVAYEQLTGPDGLGSLSERRQTTLDWCTFMRTMGTSEVLASFRTWIVSDEFFEVTRLDFNGRRRQEEQNVVTRCELDEWAREYTLQYRSLVAIFDYIATIRKYSINWSGNYNDITTLRQEMAENYVIRIEQINNHRVSATRCVGDPFTCPALSHPSHGPFRDPQTRDTDTREPVTRDPCETNQCTCENGVGDTVNCAINASPDCASCNVGYRLVNERCVPDEPICPNGRGTPARIHETEIITLDLGSVRCAEDGFQDLSEDECKAECEGRRIPFWAENNDHTPGCFLFEKYCLYNRVSNPAKRDVRSLQICKRTPQAGHHGRVFCGGCVPGFHLEAASENLPGRGRRFFQRCRAAKCPCADNGEGDEFTRNGQLCHAPFRVRENQRRPNDVHVSQCHSCPGDREVVRFNANHQFGVQYCLRTYGFIIFKFENFGGTPKAIAQGKTREDPYWEYMRSLIVLPGWCAHGREWRANRDGDRHAIYCNCHRDQLSRKQAVSFHDFNYENLGWRRLHKYRCEDLDSGNDFDLKKAARGRPAYYWTRHNSARPQRIELSVDYQHMIKDGSLRLPVDIEPCQGNDC